MADEAREYQPGERFPGVIGRTVDDSEPAWPAPVRAGEEAPNVLMVVLGDVGFGQLGCYGGPVPTPNLDRLASRGLRYTNMHTAGLSSPTRSCLLTGRNHHTNHMAGPTQLSTGYPGYDGTIPFENGFLSEILRERGYNTYAVGKWHLTPVEQTSAAGPFDRWPLGRGFERYYGFLGGATHQYYPELVEDNHRIEPPAGPEKGYHLTEDLVDRAIAYVTDAKQVAPDKPFFLYFAPGAMRAPHHAPREWIERFRGQFDQGWDRLRVETFARQQEIGLVPEGAQLPPPDPDVPRWETLGEEERRVAARMMEVYAGFLAHTDHQLGLLFGQLDELAELYNTLVMVVADNGASAEGGAGGSVSEGRFFNFVPDSVEDNPEALDELGGPKFFNHYPWGWAWAGNTPFRRWKRETYRGGTAVPLIVHWPERIRGRGQLRTQHVHAVDLVPTVLDALGVEAPETIRGVPQAPIEGESIMPTFGDAGAPAPRSTQYFEIAAHRAVHHDGWRAVCPWPAPSYAEGRPPGTPLTSANLRDLDADSWELYHVAEDPTESRNVAAEHPDRLTELIDRWYAEAEQRHVFPLDGRGQQRFADPRPMLTTGRERFTYYPHTAAVPTDQAPSLVNREHSITAVVTAAPGDEGVLVAQGGVEGGFSLYVKDRRLHYVHNYVGMTEYRVTSTAQIPEGRLELRYEFEPTGPPDIRSGQGAPGRAQLYLDGQLVGQEVFPVTVPISFSLGGGITVGREEGSPLTEVYNPPFRFTGTIHHVTIDVSGDMIVDDEATMRAVMRRE